MSEGCPIWGTAATRENGGDGVRVQSPRAGGTYRISRTAITYLDSLTPVEKARLTTWIVKRHRLGEPAPHITTEVVAQVKAARRMRIGERKDQFLRAIALWDPTLSFRFGLSGFPGDSPQAQPFIGRLLAWTECADDRDITQLGKMMVDEGLLELTHGKFDKVFLTSKAFERLDALEAANPESQQGFIAMWFDEGMADAATAIAAAIEDAGYAPMIINNKEHNGDITDAIIAEIRRSRFVVADFTCGVAEANGRKEGVPRGGVYFEAGFAMGLGIEVIWACRKDCMSYLHFDTRQHAHIVWDGPSDLREKLARRIGAVIGYGASARPAVELGEG